MPPIYATLAGVMERTTYSGVLSGLMPALSVLTLLELRVTMSLASPVHPFAPTRLRLPDLMHTTDRAADDVLSGRYDHLLPAGGVPIDERWFTRLHGDDELDVWLISWVPGPVHRTARPRRVARRADRGVRIPGGYALGRRRPAAPTVDAGDQAAFPLGWVHDVVWGARADARRRAHAQRARLFAAADRDVVLRGDRPQHAASQPHRTDRQPGGRSDEPMTSRIDAVLDTARAG